jgi:hypothetical protein
MKSCFIIILFLLITGNSFEAFAQNKSAQSTVCTAPKMPMDDEKKLISYQGVAELSGTKIELYLKALAWFNAYYKNPSEKLRAADSTNGKIEGFIRFKIYNPENKDGLKTEAGMVQYSLIMEFKDGKFRYTITNLNWKQTSYYALEKWMDKTDQYYTPFFDCYLLQTDDELKKVIKDLTTYMKRPVAKKEGNW